MKKILFLFVILLMGCQKDDAIPEFYKISGRVLMQNFNLPIPDVYITLNDSTFEVTDMDGLYQVYAKPGLI